MRPIFLIGYMGSGKSTLARAASRVTGLGLIDLDLYIEGRFHRSVSEIFADKGEHGFREIESRMLREVGEFENVIVACGGGTPCFGDNMDYMNRSGITVWLNASPERLHQRLVKARRKRPLIAKKTDEEILDIIHAGLDARNPYYSKALLTLPADRLEDRSQIADTTALFIELTGIKSLNSEHL